MKRIAAVVGALCVAVCVGCSDTGPTAVAQRTAPPKPAAPPPGDKGDDEPAVSLPIAPSNPAATPGNPVTVPVGPAATPSIPATGPAPAAPVTAPFIPDPGFTAPGKTPANPGPNPAVPAAGPAPPAGAIPPFPGTNPATPAPNLIPPIPGAPAATPATPAVAPTPEKPAPAANPFANLVPGSTPPASNAPAAGPPTNTTVVPIADADTRGKDYGPGANFVAYPISTLFAVKNQIMLNQINKAMRDFRALNNRFPKDQAEYEKEIIQANGIQLEPLNEGEKYWYDAKSGEYNLLKPKK